MKKFRRNDAAEMDLMAREIANYFLGNPKKNIKPKNIREISDLTGKKSRQTIYNYLDHAITLGIPGIVKDEKTGHYERAEITITDKFETFSNNHPILQHPLIEDWVKHGLANGGFSGNGVVNTPSLIQGIAKLCNFCKISPTQLIQDRETSSKFLEKYLDGLRDGTIQRRQLRVNSSPESAFIQIKMAARSFMQYHDITLRKGLGGIWNAKVIDHGNYADVRLTKEQFVKMENYLLNHGGIDSDLYRLVWIGIESCARKSALFGMTLDYTKTENEDDVTYFITCFEKKTKHIKKGKQIKHITRKRTQDSLDYLKDRNTSSLIWEEKVSTIKKVSTITAEIKNMYKEIGCIGHYWNEHPIHALRHVGAHYWLNASDYDYDFVSDVGGWTTTSELKASYGEIPPEVMARKMKKFSTKIKNVGLD